MAELQHSQKFVKEVDAAIMRQTRMITADSNIFEANTAFREFLTDG